MEATPGEDPPAPVDVGMDVAPPPIEINLAEREGVGREPEILYGTDKHREWTRTAIAALLVVLLLAVELIVLFSILGSVTIENLETVATTLLTPIIGLVGTVVGFYFGQQSKP